MKTRMGSMIIAVALSLAAVVQAATPVVSISLAADLTTPIPGGTGDFTSFAPVALPPNPCISFGNVAFFGAGSAGQAGMYATLGGTLTRVADQNTTIPGATQDHHFIIWQSNPLISGNNVAFIGGDATHQGVYVSVPPSTISPIADLSTAIPGGTGNFIIWQSAAISGNQVAFIGGDGVAQTGVYRCLPTSPCTPVADTNTAIPGGSDNFVSFLPSFGISGSNVAFIGGDTNFVHNGVYVAQPLVPIFPIADTTTQAPGQPLGTLFFLFPNVSISGTNVAFRGISSPNGGKDVVDGVYVGLPPNPCISCTVPISMIADSSTAVPGGIGLFSGFGNVAIDPNNVAFEGFSNSGAVKGIYTNAGGALSKIASTGDMLGGKLVTGLNLGSSGFSGDQIVFEAEFSDGSQSIAVAALNGNRCPLSQGFWKNHQALWPETSLTLGSQNYTQAELLAILNASSNSDASVQLAKQLIAAKLDIFNGSNPAAASAAIADADGLLSAFAGKLPYNVASSSPAGQAMLQDATALINYNNGLLTPGCTP